MLTKTSILRIAFPAIAAAVTVISAVALPQAATAQRLDGPLGLEEAIALALENDEWLRANRLQEESLRQEAIYQGQLPDPQMRLGAANLPVDSFDLGQEAMTMFEVGVSQAFPSGDTLELRQRQLRIKSEQYPSLREEREARVGLEVAQVWLDAFRAQGLIDLHTIHREFIEQLVETAQVRYQAAQGSFRQQDLVLAQVELTKVDDVLVDLGQQLNESRRALAEWLPYAGVDRVISEVLPALEEPEIVQLADLDQAANFFSANPRLRAFDKEVEAALTGVEIARQSYKPGFTLGAEYAKRFEGPGGLARSDFFSLSVTFDLPLFTEKRQKPRVESASLRASALQTERILLVREIAAEYQQSLVRLERLAERETLYQDILETQLDTLIEASTAAYAADEADFEEVIGAYIARHNARVELLNINVAQVKTVTRLDYLLTGLEN